MSNRVTYYGNYFTFNNNKGQDLSGDYTHIKNKK